MCKNIQIKEERISTIEYIEFLKRTDLGSQYPKERFEERIAKLVDHVSISLVARNKDNQIVGVLFGLTDYAYWLYITDLGVDRDYLHQGIGTELIKTAHSFISSQYWQNNFELVKELLLQATVYEQNQEIQGFIGLNDEYIEGIFVSDEMRSQGIGKLLLDFVKNRKAKLSLNVYQKNTRAIHFYQREGFAIRCEGVDEATGEKEYVMTWENFYNQR